MKNITVLIATNSNPSYESWSEAIKDLTWSLIKTEQVRGVAQLSRQISELQDTPFLLITQPSFEVSGVVPTDDASRPVATILGDYFHRFHDHIAIIDSQPGPHPHPTVKVFHAPDSAFRAFVREQLNGPLLIAALTLSENPTYDEAQSLYRKLPDTIRLLAKQTTGIDRQLSNDVEFLKFLNRWDVLARFTKEYPHKILIAATRNVSADVPSRDAWYFVRLALEFQRLHLRVALWKIRAEVARSLIAGNDELHKLHEATPVGDSLHQAHLVAFNQGGKARRPILQQWRQCIKHYYTAIRALTNQEKRSLRRRHWRKRRQPTLRRADWQGWALDRQPGGVALFRQLSAEFGVDDATKVDDTKAGDTTAVETLDDVAWPLYAVQVGRLLRFHVRAAAQREAWNAGNKGRAILLGLLGLFAGYGYRLERLVGWIFGIVLGFSAIYLGNDMWGRCNGAAQAFTSPWLALTFVGEHLYIAIVSLTGLGASSTTCGPVSGAALSIETALGYFLLAISAATIIEILQER